MGSSVQTPPTPAPFIHEFTVQQLPSGWWEATAQYRITECMEAVGCRRTIRAETVRDLDLLCVAERILATHARAAAEARAVSDVR